MSLLLFIIKLSFESAKYMFFKYIKLVNTSILTFAMRRFVIFFGKAAQLNF